MARVSSGVNQRYGYTMGYSKKPKVVNIEWRWDVGVDSGIWAAQIPYIESGKDREHVKFVLRANPMNLKMVVLDHVTHKEFLWLIPEEHLDRFMTFVQRWFPIRVDEYSKLGGRKEKPKPDISWRDKYKVEDATPILQQGASLDVYATLARLTGKDISKDTDFETIKSAYRKAIPRLHPDRGGDPEKMAELNMAFQSAKKAAGQ